MPCAWRIVRAARVNSAFTGEGARVYGGRWNSRGTAVIYVSEHESLAALELLVHNEDTRRTIGEKGKKFAAEECTVPQYCRALVGYLQELRKWTPLLDITDRAAEELREMGATRELSVVDDIVKEISAIFS